MAGSDRLQLPVHPEYNRLTLIDLLADVRHFGTKRHSIARREIEDGSISLHALLENAFDDALSVLALPEKYRRLKSTNMQERRNEEIRRREERFVFFPNDQAAIRMVGALLAEKATTGKNARTSI